MKSADMSDLNSTTLSSTALYTAYVWHHNQLATIDLSQSKGFWYYQILRPFNALARFIKGVDLETVLIQRHTIINLLLEKEIESGRIKQVIELAAGFSPRGSRFVAKYAKSHQLKYIETDLKLQIQHKENLLNQKMKIEKNYHQFIAVDAFASDGLSKLKKVLDPQLGTAIISEGLLNYFPTEKVEILWQNISHFLRSLNGGIYLADTQTQTESFEHPLAKIITHMIRKASKTSLYNHYTDAIELKDKLSELKFSKIEILQPQQFKKELKLPGTSQKDMVNIIYGNVHK